MNHAPPTIPPSPPPINRLDKESGSQQWLIAAGVVGVTFLLMLLLLFALRFPVKSGDQASSSASNKPGSSSSTPGSEAGQDEPNEIDLGTEKTDSITSQEQPEQQADMPVEARPTVETEDKDLTISQSARINNSLERSSTGRQFFGIDTTGKHIGFVIDRSGSMGTGSRLKRANAELLRAIGNLPITTKISVVYFATNAEAKQEFTAFEPTKDRVERLARWSAAIRHEGGTDPVPAIKIVMKYDCDQIFLLSDGEFQPQTVKQIAAENSKQVPINTVSLSGKPESLKQVAAQSKGTFRSTNP